jgi:hypothetical protein
MAAATYTIKITDRLLRFDTTKADVLVTLLPFVQTPNAPYEIHKISTGDGHTVTISVDPSTSDFLLPDGSTALTLDDTNHTVYIKIPDSGLSPAYVNSGGGGSGSSGGGGGGVAPPVQTPLAPAELIWRNNHKLEVDIQWTPDPKATKSNFSGVAVYLEDPDISSGDSIPLDGSVAMDGTAQVSGKWVPAYQNDSFPTLPNGGGYAVVFPDVAANFRQTRNVRIYLASFGPGSPAALVPANQAGATPNELVEIPQGPDQGQSGMEWAFLITNPSVDVKTDYNRPDPKFYLVFTYDPPDPSTPVPPGVNRFGGARIVYVYYDSKDEPVFPGADTGISVPVAQSSTGYKSSVYDASAGGSKFRVYFCSEDDSFPLGQHVNSLVDGVTPWIDANVPMLPNNQLDVGNFTISDETVGWQWDNTLVAQATFAWSLPDASTAGKRYAGVRLYLVDVVADTGNDGSVPLSLPRRLTDTQANVDTSLTDYETPPRQPEVWTIAAISVDANGGLVDEPTAYRTPKGTVANQAALPPTGNTVGDAYITADTGNLWVWNGTQWVDSFHSPTVAWHIGPPGPGGPGKEHAPLVTVGAGAGATATQTMSSDGVGMVSFDVGPWTNPSDATFGGVQVALVVNGDPTSAIYWQVPNGATSFTTPPIPSFGNLGANVPVDFYLVSDDPQGHKNSLQIGGNTTPKIGSTYVPKAGEIIPARSGWFSSEFSWPEGGSFQADSFAAKKIYVGSQLVVGGASVSFGGAENGQIAVLNSSGVLRAWIGESNPGAPSGSTGQGKPGVFGGWFGQIYIGGTSPLDAPIYVDTNGIIEVGGIAPFQGSSLYPYISIRDDTGLEVGRIGAKLNVPEQTGQSGSYGGVGTAPTPGNPLYTLTHGAWFSQLAIGGSNLANWNVLITPDSTSPLGSDFLMRNVKLFQIDYPEKFGVNAEYKLEFGSDVWTGAGATQYQFPGFHLYEVDGNANHFGCTILNRGMILSGHASQSCPTLCSLVTYNGLESGADGPPYNFWAELTMYSPTNPHLMTVSLSSGANNGSGTFTLRDYGGNNTFLVDATGNAQVGGVLAGVQATDGTARAVKAYALTIYNGGTLVPVIDSTGKWVGPAIGSSQSPWKDNIDGAGWALQGAGEIHGSAYFLGGVKGAGTPLINSDGTFVGHGVDVGAGYPVYCGALSTVQHPGGSGEIDCGLLKSNNNIIATQSVNPASLDPPTGWVVADNFSAQKGMGLIGSFYMSKPGVAPFMIINPDGAWVSPGGINVGAAGIAGGGASISGRVNAHSLYAFAAAGDSDGGNIYFDQNLIQWGGGKTVINASAQFVGNAVNVGSGNVSCGSANITGALTCGSFTLQGLFTANQIAVSASPVDAVTAGLVGYGQYRAVYGSYGVILRNDNAQFYLLVTNSGDPYGSWNSLRPFYFNVSNGSVVIDGTGAGVGIGGSVNFGGHITLVNNYTNISTQANGVMTAGNFNVAPGQPGAGTIIDGSRNIYANQYFCDWWSHGQPVITQDNVHYARNYQVYGSGTLADGSRNVWAYELYNARDGSKWIDTNGNHIGYTFKYTSQIYTVNASNQTIACCDSNGVWSGGGVQSDNFILGSYFGIYGQYFGYPQPPGVTPPGGAIPVSGPLAVFYLYDPIAGRNKAVYVRGGLIVNITY